jgi:hypothetical protein
MLLACGTCCPDDHRGGNYTKARADCWCSPVLTCEQPWCLDKDPADATAPFPTGPRSRYSRTKVTSMLTR